MTLFCVISLPLNVGVLEALVPIASEPVYSNAKSNVSESLSNPFSATDQVLVICFPGPEYPLTLIPCVCEFAANAVNDIPISIAVDSIDATSFLVNFFIPYIPFHILKQLFYPFFDYIFLLRITVITSPRISFFDTAPSVLLSLDTL